MRAIEITRVGGPEVLRLVDRPEPSPSAGELLVDVAVAGVNRPDLMQREGRHPPPPGTTDIPGLEIAGVVAALGPDDGNGPPRSASGRRWHIGDQVTALVSGGGYAERCTVPAPQALPVPLALSLAEAAAIPETFFTVWTNVFERGRLARGESLLVHGGGSGIGTTAIQLASARGSEVIVTAGSDARCRACERLGAKRGINYRREDFVSVVAELTAKRGVDVVLDIVGGPYLARNVECLARDGRLVQISLIGGTSAEIHLWPVMTKRLTLTGSTLRSRSIDEKGAIAAALEREVWPLLEAGRVKPIIHSILPLADVARAHQMLEAGDVFGKLVLAIGS